MLLLQSALKHSRLVILYRRDPEFRKAHPTYTPLDVIGLTTVFGNGPVEIMTSNALKLLELMGRTGAQPIMRCKRLWPSVTHCQRNRADIPVASGEPKAREDTEMPGYATFVHGDDGFGNTAQTPPVTSAIGMTAAEFLVSQAAAAPGEVTVLAIGPLSNLRAAVELDPKCVHCCHASSAMT